MGTQKPLAEKFEFVFCVVEPAGPTWSFPADLSDAAMLSAPKMSHAEGVAHVTKLVPDVCVPHMFCFAGMTTYRSLIEGICGIPLVGCPVETMALSTNKARS